MSISASSSFVIKDIVLTSISKNTHGRALTQKFDYDLIVNVGNTDHAQSLSKKLSEILQQESRFASILIVPPDKAMRICATTNRFLLVDTHIHNDRGFIMAYFQVHRIGLTWRTGYIGYVSMIGT